MKTAVVAMLAVAGSAAADIDRSGYTIYSPSSAVALEGGDVSAQRSFSGISYSNMSNNVEGYFSNSSAAPDGDGELEVFDFDDYQSVAPGDAFLDEFGFVGGVDAAGGVVFFDFFDAGGVLVDGFGVSLASAGNFIYSIDITNNDVVVPAGGFVQATIDDDGTFTGVAATFTWFLTADDASVGDNLTAGFGSPLGNDLNYAFELVTVPAPASVALLGLGGLAAARRRR